MQVAAPTSSILETLPSLTLRIGAYVEKVPGVVHDSRFGRIALQQGLGLDYSKLETIIRKQEIRKKKSFIDACEKLVCTFGRYQAVAFADALHTTHATCPVSCEAPSWDNLAIGRTSGQQPFNFHGAIDLDTGETKMIDFETVCAASTIQFLPAIESMHTPMAMTHAFWTIRATNGSISVKYGGQSPADASSRISFPHVAHI